MDTDDELIELPDDNAVPSTGDSDVPAEWEGLFAAITADGDDSDVNPFAAASKAECSQDQVDYCAGDQDYTSANHTMCRYCGIGAKCPFYQDPALNPVTGRLIQDQSTIEYILELHNEIRSKIARGRCGQPIAGCMQPLQWDPELARVAQKWADQCTDVDYRGDAKRKDPFLFHDKHGERKTGQW